MYTIPVRYVHKRLTKSRRYRAKGSLCNTQTSLAEGKFRSIGVLLLYVFIATPRMSSAKSVMHGREMTAHDYTVNSVRFSEAASRLIQSNPISSNMTITLTGKGCRTWQTQRSSGSALGDCSRCTWGSRTASTRDRPAQAKRGARGSGGGRRTRTPQHKCQKKKKDTQLKKKARACWKGEKTPSSHCIHINKWPEHGFSTSLGGEGQGGVVVSVRPSLARAYTYTYVVDPNSPRA